MTKETRIESAVVKAAKAAGGDERKFEILPDDPDRLFMKDGRVVFIEFKAPDKPPRPGQDRRLKELRDNGFEAYLVDDVAFGKALLGV